MVVVNVKPLTSCHPFQCILKNNSCKNCCWVFVTTSVKVLCLLQNGIEDFSCDKELLTKEVSLLQIVQSSGQDTNN